MQKGNCGQTLAAELSFALRCAAEETESFSEQLDQLLARYQEDIRLF